MASVLLLVAGERLAFPLLSQLVVGHLRDCSRPSLDPILEIMQLLQPILEGLDPELNRHMQVGNGPVVVKMPWGQAALLRFASHCWAPPVPDLPAVWTAVVLGMTSRLVLLCC